MKEIFKERIDKITYGLIYPAFFGNMIYYIINISLERDKNLHFSLIDSIVIASLFVLFVIIDFMHLYGDVNSIYNKPEYKSRYYFFCDILTPVFLFTSFVFLRTSTFFDAGIIIFSLVPAVILVYKWSNPHSRLYFAVYAAISLALGLIIAFSESHKTASCICVLLGLNIVAYSIYMVCCYPKKSRQFDLNYVDQIQKKLALNPDSNNQPPT